MKNSLLISCHVFLTERKTQVVRHSLSALKPYYLEAKVNFPSHRKIFLERQNDQNVGKVPLTYNNVKV